MPRIVEHMSNACFDDPRLPARRTLPRDQADHRARPKWPTAGFHRYAMSGQGSDVSLDVPWRRPGAPNGVDERLSVDMITYTKEQGGHRLSLAFAAFPEIFDNKNRSPIESFYYGLIHLGYSPIRLESLYRYLRKFDSFDHRRMCCCQCDTSWPRCSFCYRWNSCLVGGICSRQGPRTAVGDNTLVPYP